ncbi:trigger factor [Algoriphagus halophytocola]|uniref:Trigger factor n=1 Tax=Algoriphagus halophytocola TaxID=2991499 RepID=A0ABY6MFG7_9BACT|nr:MULTISPECIES: trigger factor [unclassified Algoriphagus]UZD22532.1 trigger factor [Algoriphagus sp. TR-M5]WBL43795.1 trigger factor [Algoriphagus sp. TR-M9]
MEITLDKHSANQASIKIKLNEADYQPKVDAKLKDFAKKSNIKGFRPGKAPISMVKNIYGTSVLVEEINGILSESLNNYLKEQTFKILGEPLPVEQSETIDWKTQKDFEFDYKIGFVENIDLNLDSKIKATKYQIKVDDKLVKETIDNLLSQYGNSTNPEVSEEGDHIYGDLKATEGEFEKTVTLDPTPITKKLAGKFIKVSKGDVVEFDAKDVKKGQWQEAFGLSDEEAAEISGPMTLTVQNINRTEAAELNQEFFDKIFGPDTVKSEEEFTTKVQETLQSNYDKESKVFTEEELKKVLTETAKVDLPEEFLKEWLILANEGKVSAEDVEKEFPMYAKQLTWSLISNKVATENDIKAEHEEVIEKTKQMVREQFAASGLGAQMEDSMDMFVDNYLKGEEGQNYMNMLTSIQNEKVLAFALDKISVKEKEISIDEFKELLEK